jgi:Cu+-exporting ATPase
MEAGDIVILGGNLPRIYEAIRISSLSLRKIKQNLFWAFFYNSIGIGLASGLLYHLTGIHLNPLIAGIAMILSDLVVPNSLLMSKLYRTVNGVASATHFARRELGI